MSQDIERDFEKDKAGQTIYPVRTAKLNTENCTVLSTVDELVALAAEYGTPHFKFGRTHYCYVHYCGLVVAYDSETATKPATFFSPPSNVCRFGERNPHAGVQAAPPIEVMA